eukprot:3309935-Amphidinium_carterae.4
MDLNSVVDQLMLVQSLMRCRPAAKARAALYNFCAQWLLVATQPRARSPKSSQRCSNIAVNIQVSMTLKSLPGLYPVSVPSSLAQSLHHWRTAKSAPCAHPPLASAEIRPVSYPGP